MLHNNGLLVNSSFNKYSNKTPEKFGYMKDMCGILIPRCVFSYISFTPNFYINSLTYKDYKYRRIWQKRPMGHIAHLRKQFRSINIYDYIITWIKRRKKTLLSFWELNGSSFQQNWIPFTQGCFVPSLFEIGLVVQEKKIFFFNFVNVFSLFHNCLPLEKGEALHKNKFESPLPKAALFQVWLSCSGEEDFRQCIFAIW